MTIPKYFDIPFANSGDVVAVPDATQLDGSVSYEQGYPVTYSTLVSSGGLNIERTKMNQLFNDVTLNLQQLQNYGVPAWYAAATYNKYSTVLYTDGIVYQSLVDTNLNVIPTSDATKWSPVALGNPTKSYVSVTASTGTLTLTAAQTANAVINFSGTLTGHVAVQFASTATKGLWIINNNTTGNFYLTVGYATGAVVKVPRNRTIVVWGDGSNCYSGIKGTTGSGHSAAVTAGDIGERQTSGVLSANLTSAALPTLQTIGSFSVPVGTWKLSGYIILENNSGSTPVSFSDFIAGFGISTGAAIYTALHGSFTSPADIDTSTIWWMPMSEQIITVASATTYYMYGSIGSYSGSVRMACNADLLRII